MLMILAHGVDEDVVRQITEAYPKDKDGQEVDPSPYIKPSRKHTRKINEYLVERRKRLSEASSVAKAASTTKVNEENVETSTAGGADAHASGN